MSRKKIITFTLLPLLMILIIFYAFYTSRPDEFVEASQDEIAVWALENDVKILDSVNVKNDTNPYVLVLYEDNDEQKYGIYQVEKRKKKLTHTNVLSTVKNNQPIQVLGVRSGVPVVFLIFNDQDLLDRGENLEIFIGNNQYLQQIDHESKVYSITYNSDDGTFSEQNIIIYDKKGNIIFDDFAKIEQKTDVDLYSLYYSLASKV